MKHKILRNIEGQIQEIVFFSSLVISITTFLAGIFYLTLDANTLQLIMGQFGQSLAQIFFSGLGYATFYIAVMALHMGYVTNFHVFSFKDLKREYPTLLSQLIAHLLVIFLFSNLLASLEIIFDISGSARLQNGVGGLAGQTLAPLFSMALGGYGSLLVFASLIAGTSIVAGFFDIPEVLMAMKDLSKKTEKLTKKSMKSMNSFVDQLQIVHRARLTPAFLEHHLPETKRWVQETVRKASEAIEEGLNSAKKSSKAKVSKKSKKTNSTLKATPLKKSSTGTKTKRQKSSTTVARKTKKK